MKRFLRFLGHRLSALGRVKVPPLVITQVTSAGFGDVFGLGEDQKVYLWDVDTGWKQYQYSAYLKRERDLDKLFEWVASAQDAQSLKASSGERLTSKKASKDGL